MSEKLLFRIICAITAVVLLIVVGLRFIERPAEIPAFAKFLPKLNAIINTTCTLLLLASVTFIKRGNVTVHKRLNVTAFILSTIFLLSYVIFHSVAPHTEFPKDNPLRWIYYPILFSHILLAMIVLPLVLLSFWRGLANQIPQHRKIVRWSFPIWLYVTATGPIVYLMISPHYLF